MERPVVVLPDPTPHEGVGRAARDGERHVVDGEERRPPRAANSCVRPDTSTSGSPVAETEASGAARSTTRASDGASARRVRV
jgi:hypothetical protein